MKGIDSTSGKENVSDKAPLYSCFVQVHSHTSAPYASRQQDQGRCKGLWGKSTEERNQHKEAGWSYSQPVIRKECVIPVYS